MAALSLPFTPLRKKSMTNSSSRDRYASPAPATSRLFDSTLSPIVPENCPPQPTPEPSCDVRKRLSFLDDAMDDDKTLDTVASVDLFFVFIFISRQAGLNTIQQLDVDAFFTNSHEALELLKPHAPHTEFMLLAAESPSSTAPRPVSTASTIVFVGNAIGISTKRDLATMLREAIPFGLTIYGYAWDLVPEFTPYWGGILPPEDLPRVYS
ncbi:hypothetical protein DYB28_013907, partial [Aphanomyces astaci]